MVVPAAGARFATSSDRAYAAALHSLKSRGARGAPEVAIASRRAARVIASAQRHRHGRWTNSSRDPRGNSSAPAKSHGHNPEVLSDGSAGHLSVTHGKDRGGSTARTPDYNGFKPLLGAPGHVWIVHIALRRPYTFIVLALLILVISPLVILRTPTDIFPNINIPVVSILWNYTGLNAEEMEQRITSVSERILTTVVNDIDHIESQTVEGLGIIKVFFHPGVKLDTAFAQVASSTQPVVRLMPPGITPPLTISYNASSVPILQLSLSGYGLAEQQLNDIATNFIRTQLATVPGAAVPWPYGGKQRQVMIDLDTAALQSKGLSPADVVTAVGTQNLILPGGTSKIGPFEYDVDINGSPKTVEELNDLPVRALGHTAIYVRDVAHVRDGFTPQTNVVRRDGQRGSLLTVMKVGSVSTLDIVQRVKETLRSDWRRAAAGAAHRAAGGPIGIRARTR